jgi:hypothetical protein
MYNHFLDDNILKKHFLIQNQKLDFSFSSDDFDIESSYQNINQTSSEKELMKNKFYNDNIILNLTELTPNNKNNFDKISESNFNPFFSTTTDNNISFIFDDITFPLNKIKFDNDETKKWKIFKIIKANNKKGRMKKNSVIKGNHNNFSQDNIIRKIKARFLEKLRKYLNSEYQSYLFKKNFKKHKNNNWLKKINPKMSREIRKEDNLKWFDAKIWEIFSENISERYSNSSVDLNKRKIKRIYIIKEAKNITNILNSKVEFYFDKYVNDEQIEGFKTLKDELKELEVRMKKTNQENIEEYLEKYKFTAINMKDIFLNKISRKNNNKINKD